MLSLSLHYEDSGNWHTPSCRRWDVGCLCAFAQILIEAAFLSLLGCAVGLATGYEGTKIATARANLPFGFEVTTARLALLVATLMNLACAVLPAAKADRVRPIAALRYE